MLTNLSWLPMVHQIKSEFFGRAHKSSHHFETPCIQSHFSSLSQVFCWHQITSVVPRHVHASVPLQELSLCLKYPFPYLPGQLLLFVQVYFFSKTSCVPCQAQVFDPFSVLPRHFRQASTGPCLCSLDISVGVCYFFPPTPTTGCWGQVV